MAKNSKRRQAPAKRAAAEWDARKRSVAARPKEKSATAAPRQAAPAPAPVSEPVAPGSSAGSHGFPVVGIGTSAGGLEALETFLKHVPRPSGAAFVIVQHLDPTHKNMLVELLQRSTEMPVHRLAERVLIQRFSPLGILCNDQGEILYVSGRAGKYLEPAVGKANLNIFAMARDGLRFELSKAFAAASREGRAVVAHGVPVGTNGSSNPPTKSCRARMKSSPRPRRRCSR